MTGARVFKVPIGFSPSAMRWNRIDEMHQNFFSEDYPDAEDLTESRIDQLPYFEVGDIIAVPSYDDVSGEYRLLTIFKKMRR